jgi:hypothetical protein
MTRDVEEMMEQSNSGMHKQEKYSKPLSPPDPMKE